ncbi:hypothetical protein GCM10022236_51600 [Microlunatus ginsengisoli]|uniref:Uncharacterized protein n=1 Tax=Microlunatus ginsengisoli TaxID=363863 RepID=A0ABP7AWY6_9ACTN
MRHVTTTSVDVTLRDLPTQPTLLADLAELQVDGTGSAAPYLRPGSAPCSPRSGRTGSSPSPACQPPNHEQLFLRHYDRQAETTGPVAVGGRR